MIRGLIENGKDATTMFGLSSRYKAERQKLKLERPTPFESTAFLGAMKRVVEQLGPEITKYHLISDEMSAHIPTEILHQVQQRYNEKNGLSPDEADRGVSFIAASHRYDNGLKIIQYFQQHLDFFRQGPNLFVTDNLDSGDTLGKMKRIFDRLEIPFDIVVLSHYENLSEYEEFLKGKKVIFGESSQSNMRKNSAGAAVIGGGKLVGLTSDPHHTTAHPIEIEERYRNRPLEELVKKQTQDFANQLALP